MMELDSDPYLMSHVGHPLMPHLLMEMSSLWYLFYHLNLDSFIDTHESTMLKFELQIRLLKGYIKSKTLAEKAMLSYNDFDDSKLEVVTLPCGLVGGESLLSYLSVSVGVILAQLTGDLFSCDALNLMQEFMGSVPLVHIDDVCRAHIFCMEQPSMKGRFSCAVACHSIKEIAIYFQETYPEYKIHKE